MNVISRGVPFPECAETCDSVRVLGFGECESVCPRKFDKNIPGLPAPRTTAPRTTAPRTWQCLPNAFAKATGYHLDEIIEAVGHDGSEIVEPGKLEPYNRRGFLLEELTEALWNLGWAVTIFRSVVIPVCLGDERDVIYRDIQPYMWGNVGVVCGVFDNTYHAEYWDGAVYEGAYKEVEVQKFCTITERGVYHDYTCG